jgi:cation transport protein ChaC
MRPLWVFGYGSLVWDPGFDPVETVTATLAGYGRSFCMRSIHHRGTVARPGLVLALDAGPGALCRGLALRVAEAEAETVLAYLRERELISSAYLELSCPVHLDDGRQIQALAYVVDRGHAQYCGGLALEEQARIIATAQGGRGPNSEYLYNTARHLAELGIDDPDLAWLDARVRTLTRSASEPRF